jgi:ribose transport system substrate-binding protein
MKLFAKKRLIAVVVAFVTTASVAACASSGAGSGDASSSGAKSASEAIDVTGDLPGLDKLRSGLEAAPPKDGPPVAQGKKVALISCGEEYALCAVMGKEMKKAADVLGWNLKVYDGAGNIGGGFAVAIRQAIAAAPDAIITYGIDCAAAKQPLQEARDAKITVLGLETLDCDESGNGDALYSAPTYYNAEAKNGKEYWTTYGTAVAAYIANDRPDAKVIAVGTSDEPTGGLIYDALAAGLKAWCPKCQIVEKVSGLTADAVPGGPIAQHFQSALVQHPDVTAIYMPYDSFWGSTVNGLKVVNDAGLRSKTLLVGGLGAEEGMGYVRDGKLDADPHAIDKGWLAWAALDQLNRMFNGKPPVAEGVGPRLVDEKQDVPASGPYVTGVDYQSAYKAIWTK